MSPIIIIEGNNDTITLKVEELKKYLSDAYYIGYSDGIDKGKIEEKEKQLAPYTITYKDTTPWITCTNGSKQD